MSDLQLCTYDQSRKLKTLGFDWYTPSAYLDKKLVKELGWCNKWKTHEPTLKIPEEMQKVELVSCPTTTVAIKWFRDTRTAVLEITPLDSWNAWVITVLFADIMSPFFTVPTELVEYETYELAEIAGIDFILKELNDR